MNQERRPITVEDLLRLKRAERPADEFWQQFDRELRAKQLSALVAKRPWWQRLPRISSRFAQYRLPLGAAAALAVTFISVRDYSVEATAVESHVEVTSSNLDSGVAGAAYVHRVDSDVMTIATSSSDASAPFSDPQAISVQDDDAADIAVEARLTSDSVLAGQLSRMVPLFGGTGNHAIADTSPSARSIAANLRAAELMETLGAGLLGTSSGHGFESRALPARSAVVDPLQQMTPPGEMRRARYLTAMVSTSTEESLDRTTARMAHRISGEELYEQVQRFGTRRGGFNVKF